MADFVVYAAEVEAGLADAVKVGNRLVMACATTLDSPRILAPRLRMATAANIDQVDLHYLKSILVTTGVNKNDDFFECLETWAARLTPEDKPFNYEHNEDDIIGHITDCRVIGTDGNEIPADTAVANLPAKFHIATGAVLYKRFENPDRQQRIDKVIAELAQNKWFVSMECLFQSFDYVLLPEDGDVSKASIVTRNNDTAFLTKHLRAFGGNGTYKNKKLGRVLRQITFHGKGLVRNPANPESVIFTDAQNTAEGSVAKKIERLEELQVYFSNDEADTTKESLAVANESTNTVALDKQIAELVAKNESLTKQLTEAQAKDWEKQVATLRQELEAAMVAVKAGETKAGELQEQLDQTTTSLKATTEAKVAAEKSLATIEAEKRTAARLAKVTKAYEVEGDEAVSLTNSLAALSDEAFDATIKAQEAALARVKAKVSSLPLGESNVSGLPAPMAGDPKKVPVNGGPTGHAPPDTGKTVTASETEPTVVAAEQALAGAKPNTEVAPTVQPEIVAAGVEELKRDITSWWNRGKKTKTETENA